MVGFFLSAQLFVPNVVTIKLSVVMMQNTFNCHNKRPIRGIRVTRITPDTVWRRDFDSTRWGHTTQKASVCVRECNRRRSKERRSMRQNTHTLNRCDAGETELWPAETEKHCKTNSVNCFAHKKSNKLTI